jgi:hypothetical protein
MDQLRARAYIDLLLGLDSRPPVGHDATPDDRDGPGPDDSAPGGSGPNGPGPAGPDQTTDPPLGGPLVGVIPPGFAGKANLTIPLVTLLGIADRPGELGSVGPVDPALARDLAAAPLGA